MALPEFRTANGSVVRDSKGSPELDFEAWLTAETPELERIVSDGLDTLRKLPLKRKYKYCYVVLSNEQRDAIKSISGLVNAWQSSINVEAERIVDSAGVNEALHPQKEPTTLITAAWINACLKHESFQETPLGKELEEAGLGNGLPDNSVVPSLRIACPPLLKAILDERQIRKPEQYNRFFPGFHTGAGNPIPGDLVIDHLLNASGKNPATSACRITTFAAEHFRNCLVELFKKTNREAQVPPLDALFPLDIDWTYRGGAKRKSTHYSCTTYPIRNPVLPVFAGNLLSA